MKTLKTLTAALLIIFSSAAFAADDAESNKSKMTYALNSYIEAVSKGNIKGIAAILDADVKYTIAKSNGVISFNKSQLLEYFKGMENIEQNCATSYSVLELGRDQTLIKVSMKYDGFTKLNFVTLNNTDKGWKITNISVTFE